MEQRFAPRIYERGSDSPPVVAFGKRGWALGGFRFMLSDSTTLVAIITFLAGFAAKGVSDWLQDRRLTMRERDARREARRDFLRQRCSEFQRQNLLELQEASMKLVRATAQLYLHDEVSFRRTREWQREPIPGDVNEGTRSLQAETATLVVRIHDSEVRELTSDLKSACTEVVFGRTYEVSERIFQQLGPIHLKLNERIGLILRSLDDEDLAATYR